MDIQRDTEAGAIEAEGLLTTQPQPLAVAYIKYSLRFSDMPKGEFFGSCLSPKRVMVRNIVCYKGINYKVTVVHYSKDLKNNTLTVKAV